MKKILKKGTKENDFFREYWDYIQNYAIVEDNDNYWDNARDDGNNLINKYHRNPFVSKLVMAFLIEQDDINMNNNKKKEIK